MTGYRILMIARGIHSLGFAIFHEFFWRIFHWKSDLTKCSVASRAIIQIANLRLIYIFLGIAALCFFLPDDLLTTRLGHLVLGGLGAVLFAVPVLS